MKHTDPQDLQTTDRPVEKLLELADLLEQSKSFDIRHCFHQCGTPACLSGHWDALHSRHEQLMTENGKEMGLKKMFYGIPALFHPMTVYDVLGRPATAQDAAKVIRHFALTGEEDWGVALR